MSAGAGTLRVRSRPSISRPRDLWTPPAVRSGVGTWVSFAAHLYDRKTLCDQEFPDRCGQVIRLAWMIVVKGDPLRVADRLAHDADFLILMISNLVAVLQQLRPALADAAKALETMLVAPAKIVPVDLKMPGRDGFWLIERLRTTWPDTAIIVATAAAEMEIVTRSKRAGAVDYVLKPFGRELLWQALTRVESRSATNV